MKCGSLLLSCVLLIVLAIPLFADQTLVNPVGEFSAISTINTEEVPFHEQELIDSNIPILAVGINKRYLPDSGKSRQSVLIEKTVVKVATNGYGGVRRIKSGRH